MPQHSTRAELIKKIVLRDLSSNEDETYACPVHNLSGIIDRVFTVGDLKEASELWHDIVKQADLTKEQLENQWCVGEVLRDITRLQVDKICDVLTNSKYELKPLYVGLDGHCFAKVTLVAEPMVGSAAAEVSTATGIVDQKLTASASANQFSLTEFQGQQAKADAKAVVHLAAKKLSQTLNPAATAASGTTQATASAAIPAPKPAGPK